MNEPMSKDPAMHAPEDAEVRAAVAAGIRRLTDWAAGFRLAGRDGADPLAPFPPGIPFRAARVIGDNLAAALAASPEPEVGRVHRQLVLRGGAAECTLLSDPPSRTDRFSAALGNGIAGSWCELDEGYRLAPCHAGLYTLPALWAEAEAGGLTVAEVLACAVLAYEVTGRFARCWIFPQMTLHPHPQTAAIGGAIATTLARRSDEALTHQAVTAAATLVTVGGYEHALHGALVRNVWAAVGTANGMRAADWAECGLGGLPDGAYDVFTTLLGQAADPAALADGLGETWAIGSGYHKVHACCQSTHSAVEATQAAMASLPPGYTHADVESVLLETHRPQMSNPRPGTTLAARFSFEHVLATVQVHGHAGADAFAAATLDDPAIVRLRERIRLEPYAPVRPRPLDRPARVTLTLSDGTRVTGECLSARGGPDRPFDDAQIRAKAQGITGTRHPGFVAAVEALERLEPATLAQPWSAWMSAALAR